jgi:hypothetical protein
MALDLDRFGPASSSESEPIRLEHGPPDDPVESPTQMSDPETVRPRESRRDGRHDRCAPLSRFLIERTGHMRITYLAVLLGLLAAVVLCTSFDAMARGGVRPGGGGNGGAIGGGPAKNPPQPGPGAAPAQPQPANKKPAPACAPAQQVQQAVQQNHGAQAQQKVAQQCAAQLAQQLAQGLQAAMNQAAAAQGAPADDARPAGQ